MSGPTRLEVAVQTMLDDCDNQPSTHDLNAVAKEAGADFVEVFETMRRLKADPLRWPAEDPGETEDEPDDDVEPDADDEPAADEPEDEPADEDEDPCDTSDTSDADQEPEAWEPPVYDWDAVREALYGIEEDRYAPPNVRDAAGAANAGLRLLLDALNIAPLLAERSELAARIAVIDRMLATISPTPDGAGDGGQLTCEVHGCAFTSGSHTGMGVHRARKHKDLA